MIISKKRLEHILVQECNQYIHEKCTQALTEANTYRVHAYGTEPFNKAIGVYQVGLNLCTRYGIDTMSISIPGIVLSELEGGAND